MPKLFPLNQLESFDTNELQDAIDGAPEFNHLRDAVGEVVRAIHGLPKALGCELRQIEVYLGRSGRTADHVRNRWRSRFGQFDQAPSTHALAVFRSSTAQLRNESWERAAQRVIGALDRNKALCCANVVAGSNGPVAGNTADHHLHGCSCTPWTDWRDLTSSCGSRRPGTHERERHRPSSSRRGWTAYP
jgi:hypothetical protein